MNSILKTFVISVLISLLSFFMGCDRELKEHPMPASLKRRLEMQNDPQAQRKKVSGTITIAKVATQPKSAMLFIFARPKGQEIGPPLAVKRLPGVSFPFSYSIGQMDTMLEGSDFSGEVQITARLDADGLAGAGPGDLEGKALARVGSKEVDIVLSFTTSKEAASSETISGTIDLSKTIKDNRLPYLFIFVRPHGAPPGSPPLAVQRVTLLWVHTHFLKQVYHYL